MWKYLPLWVHVFLPFINQKTGRFVNILSWHTFCLLVKSCLHYLTILKNGLAVFKSRKAFFKANKLRDLKFFTHLMTVCWSFAFKILCHFLPLFDFVKCLKISSWGTPSVSMSQLTLTKIIQASILETSHKDWTWQVWFWQHLLSFVWEGCAQG